MGGDGQVRECIFALTNQCNIIHTTLTNFSTKILVFQHSTCWLLKMLLYWQSLKWFSIVGAVLFKLFWSFMIAYKYKLSMCLVVNYVVVICDCLQVHKCCNPIQVYVFRSINVMSPGGCGRSFIVTSNVVGVYMDLCISLKVWDSVVHYWSW